MLLVKYVLSKTGLFPKWEPQVSDVLDVALNSHEIRCVRTNRGKHFFYVIPAYQGKHFNAKLLRTFRANGVILHRHFSHEYGTMVYRVRDRNQQFMIDAATVSRDASKFQGIMQERLQERENKKHILRGLFGKYER